MQRVIVHIVAMIKLKNILNEIGEGSAKPYKWKADHKPHMVYGIKTTKYEYVWETDSGLKYVFTIDPVWMEEVPNHMGNWVASFGPFEKGEALYDLSGRQIRPSQKQPDYETQTNRGELFNIMATIVDIFKDFMKKEKDSEFGLDMVYYEPAKTKDDERTSKQRDKLYKAYIQKHLPGARVKSGTDFTRIHFK